MRILKQKKFGKGLDSPSPLWYNTIKKAKENKNMEWKKIDEQQAKSSWMGYEDYISADGKTVKRVWYDGFEEEWEA